MTTRSWSIDPELKDRIVYYLANGMITKTEAAVFANVNFSTISGWLKDRGIDYDKARDAYLRRLNIPHAQKEPPCLEKTKSPPLGTILRAH